MSSPAVDGTPRHLVGLLGGSRVASVDDRGTVAPERALWSLEWWIGADDRWHVPAREPAVRQSLVEGMPVVRTAMRVPGGDAVHEVYGASGDVVVVDIENASSAPFVVAFVVRGANVVAFDDTTAFVDGIAAFTALRPPSRWASATDGTIADIVMTGGARDGAMPVARDRGARVDAAFLYPVAHRTRLRVAVALGRHDSAGLGAFDLTATATTDAVVRGWQAQLDRGMRVELPDAAAQGVVDTARAQLLLAGQAWHSDSVVVAALEDWGFDEEALSAWARLGFVARRRAKRREPAGAGDGSGWAAWRGGLGALAASPGALLLALRRLLVTEDGDRITLLPEWPSDWRGQPVDVREAPTRLGPVSFSVRWHGDRAALLWDVPAGAVVCAPGLDPTWTTQEPRGETLLGPST